MLMDIKAARRFKHRAYVRLPAVALRHTAISPRDVFVLSYPRSGNTWVRFMLAHLVLGREPSFDDVFSHIPPVGRHRGAPGVLPDGGRLIKSHERPAPPHGSSYRKAVYLVRDGRDVSVSYYYWYLQNALYEGPFDGFLRLFLAGRLDGFGAWHEHVRSWLTSAPARANALLVVRYEDLVARPTENLGRIAEFVGLEATREQLEDALVSREQVEAALLSHGGRRTPDRRQPGGRLFTAQERELFQSAAGDVLAELGYERNEPPPASEARSSNRGAHA
jgi:hypothetical protein